jgi:hypothetical protein
MKSTCKLCWLKEGIIPRYGSRSKAVVLEKIKVEEAMCRAWWGSKFAYVVCVG